MSEFDDDASRRLVEASAWRVHLTEIDADSTEQFEAWLLSDTRNLQAWRQVEVPWDYLGEHAAEPEILAVRSAALGLPHFGRQSETPSPPWRRIVAAVLVMAGALGGVGIWWLQPIDYQTSLGERRTLTLTDGSRLSLDSNSEVKVSFGVRGRNLEILRGQARFEVAHDAARPFLVTANNATVRATGTDFDVDLLTQAMVVTLLQGRITVSNPEHLATLKPGEQLTLIPGRVPVVSEASLSDVLAWQNGQVVFHDAPLSAVVDCLNRYDKVQFVLADPSLGTRRVSGTFRTGDAPAIAEILTRYLAIRAIYSDGGRITLHA